MADRPQSLADANALVDCAATHAVQQIERVVVTLDLLATDMMEAREPDSEVANQWSETLRWLRTVLDGEVREMAAGLAGREQALRHTQGVTA